MPESVFRLPSLGADMDRGTLVRWAVKPGQRVARGQIVAEIETDKGLVDVESFHDAVFTELLVTEGYVGRPGDVLARIEVDGDAVDARVMEASKQTGVPTMAAATSGAPALARQEEAAPPPAATVAPASTPPPTPDRAGTTVPPAGAGERVRASPYARRRARELGVDLAHVPPGAEGRVNAADVEAFARRSPAPSPSSSAPPASADPQPAMRRGIALAMARAKREIPHYYLAHTVDVTDTLAWLTRANEARPITARLLPAVVFLRAVARACRAVPELNGHWVDDGARASEHVNVCFATAIRKGGGLIAPALLDVDTRSLDELMTDIASLVDRVRGGKLTSRERSEGTITLTSLGDNGVEELFPIIQPPQLAIVGMGKVVERPWVKDGAVAVRKTLRITLAGDHRATDGATGSRFLRAVERALDPAELAGEQ